MPNSAGQAKAALVDLLFPPRCAGCGRLGTHWCEDCQHAVVRITEPICEHCGFPLAKDQECPSCAMHKFAFTQARAYARYETGLRHAILKLKHRQNKALGEALGKYLAQLFEELDWQIDFMVAIPLAKMRTKFRGYNQIELLAVPLSKAIDIPIQRTCLLRKQETKPQMDLLPAERWSNVQDAFAADALLANGKRVLVVDDIITTGATMHAAALALSQAGADEVFALALAQAG